MMTRVLVAPLDWGLGHATRCIPVIESLQRHNCEVILAGSGASLEVLNSAFPDLKAIALPGYAPVYPRTGSMVLAMLRQLPKFMKTIREEHDQLPTIIRSHKIDIVISDNRYGLYTREVPCVLVTHQSNILMPKRFGSLAPMVRRMTMRFMNKFATCWIPDFPEPSGMAGKLVAFGKHKIRVPVEFIGALSRFRHSGTTEKKFDVVAVLSGPEPQRSLLEELIARQLYASSVRYLIVRGLPQKSGAANALLVSQKGEAVNFLQGDELQQVIEQAYVIISRSGYSTLMDLAALGSRAVLIPTPGQTEQEYLADEMMRRGVAFSMRQHTFDLTKALSMAPKYSGFKDFPAPNTLLDAAVKKILNEKAG